MESAADTIIFLDIDGVLNVGARDDDGRMLVLTQGNVNLARGCFEPGLFDENAASVARVAAAAARYGDLVSPDDSDHLSPVLVERLARLLQAAAAGGGRPSVVLSSTWRLRRHAARVRRLERRISEALGRRFEFDGRTELAEEREPVDRLRCIGNYVTEHCALHSVRVLRVVILDDFFAMPLDGWRCDRRRICSARQVEAFVRDSARRCANVRVKLVHCFEEWKMPEGGLRVQVGAGLSETNIDAVRVFLATAALDSGCARMRRNLSQSMLSWLSASTASSFNEEPAEEALASAVQVQEVEGPPSAALCLSNLVGVAPLLCLQE